VVVRSAGAGCVDGCDVVDCTLREAIALANATSGPATIRFAIPGEGVQTISPATELPAIFDALTIDGYTQPGAMRAHADTPANLTIELRGSGDGGPGVGLVVAGSHTVIRGLAINSFGEAGIVVSGTFSRQGLTDVVIAGNVIGPDPAGANRRGASQDAGIEIRNPGGKGTTSALTIGGTDAGDRNILSANTVGVKFWFADTSYQNRVVGNYIGTTSTGNAPLANDIGLLITYTPGIIVGGGAHAERNVISGNTRFGVVISDASFTRVEGNAIGVGADGQSRVGNGAGILLEWDSSGRSKNTIGGRNGRAGNVIAFNAGNGVVIAAAATDVPGPPTIGNSILGNSIYENGGLGIDLGGDGVTVNDAADSDEGANNLQNTPVLTSARSNPASTTVAGTIESSPGGTYLLEFFGNPADDPAAGRTFLGQKRVTTGNDGAAAFTALVDRVPVGDAVTATATNVTRREPRDTSELSAPVTVQASTGGDGKSGGKHEKKHKGHKHGKNGHGKGKHGARGNR
jgi:hypothetical protein